ncbi:hypothetical protein [Streptomyces violascens]|uniref:Integral membrane protein n=1 Tax=Streptomyces violascens TaxID=67381 RepID=A0ABQ3QX96_9ACTN|nr:hypothetical protein [Streptomyces violascens]GGU13156.1 hypothetical protein GCM10010289_38510 [Streptomyces violascens]GHI41901.1 hypothetical protein Sviol_63090 [Streptomyces violascens]
MSRLNRAASRLATGATLLARRIIDRTSAWVRAGRREDLTGWQASLGCWVRLALVVAGVWIAWRIVRAAPAVLWAVLPVLGLAAWRAGRPPRKPVAPAAAAAEVPEPAEEQPVSTLSDAEFIDLVRRCIGPRSGVHLAVLPDLLGELTGEPWSGARVRASLKAAGVPVSGSVRMRGRKVSTGVRLDALPCPSPTPPVAPPVGVVPAGQDPATPGTTTTATPSRRRVGDWIVEAVDDARNPAATHVRATRAEVNKP